MNCATVNDLFAHVVRLIDVPNTKLALLQSLSNHCVTVGEHTCSSSGPESAAKLLF